MKLPSCLYKYSVFAKYTHWIFCLYIYISIISFALTDSSIGFIYDLINIILRMSDLCFETQLLLLLFFKMWNYRHTQEDDGFLCTYLQKHGEKRYQSHHSKQYAKERWLLPDNFFIRFCKDLKCTEMKHVIRSWQTVRITDLLKRGDDVGSPPQWSRWRWCWTPAAWLRWSGHRWFLPKYTATQKCWNASL